MKELITRAREFIATDADLVHAASFGHVSVPPREQLCKQIYRDARRPGGVHVHVHQH